MRKCVQLQPGEMTPERVHGGTWFLLTDGSWFGVDDFNQEHDSVSLRLPIKEGAIRVAGPTAFEIVKSPTDQQRAEIARMYRISKEGMVWDLHPDWGVAQHGSGTLSQFLKVVDKAPWMKRGASLLAAVWSGGVDTAQEEPVRAIALRYGYKPDESVPGMFHKGLDSVVVRNDGKWSHSSLDYGTEKGQGADALDCHLDTTEGESAPRTPAIIKQEPGIFAPERGVPVTSNLLKKADVPQLQELDAPVAKEYDAVRWVYQQYLDNRIQSLSWQDFQKKFQQFAQKYPKVWMDVRQNRPHITTADMERWMDEYKPQEQSYELEHATYHDPETSYRDAEQLVLRINQSADASRILAQDPLLAQYVDMVGQSSEMSGHPAAKKTVGWLRVDFVDEDWLLVDEVQSDLVNSVSQAKLILEADSFDDFMASLRSDKMREMVAEKGINAATFRQAKAQMLQHGYNLDSLEEIKRKLIHLFENWAEYGIASLIELARRHGIKNVAIHTAETISTRDEAVEGEKVHMYYDRLAKSFGFRKQQVDVGDLRGNFWVRTAARKKKAAKLYPATDEWINRAKNFLKEKWAERHLELGREGEPMDMKGACKFASLFAQALFGGQIRGNPDHQLLKTPDRIIDLTDLWDQETFYHDKDFFGNPAHIESMISCEPRVWQWVKEFNQRYNIDKIAGFSKKADTDILVGDDESSAYGNVIPIKELDRWAAEYLPGVTRGIAKLVRLLKDHKKIATLEGIEVGKEKRGQGLGKTLLYDFIAEAKTLGATAIVAIVDTAGKQREGFDLIGWYKGQGFKLVPISGAVFPVMIRDLTSKSPKTPTEKARSDSRQTSMLGKPHEDELQDTYAKPKTSFRTSLLRDEAEKGT